MTEMTAGFVILIICLSILSGQMEELKNKISPDEEEEISTERAKNTMSKEEYFEQIEIAATEQEMNQDERAELLREAAREWDLDKKLADGV